MTEYANEAPYKREFYDFKSLDSEAARQVVVNKFLNVCEEFNRVTISKILAEEGQNNVNKYVS